MTHDCSRQTPGRFSRRSMLLTACAAAASVHRPLRAAPPGPRITFINPGISNPADPTGAFWTSVTGFMQAAATQLGIELEVLYAERDHVRMQQLAKQVAQRAVRPDYLVVVNEKLAAEEMVRAADAAGINVFVMLNTFIDEQVARMGQPRERYKQWIGSLIPDNVFAGQEIARKLLAAPLPAGTDAGASPRLLAIAGDPATPASVQRLEGLHQALAAHPGDELQQTVLALWREDLAYERGKIALSRYPQTNLIWAANDPMALGVTRAAVEAGRKPGHDIFIAGLNWDPQALEKVRDGTLVASVGGHFMVGGWSLVLLYDHFRGRDFATEGLAIQRPIFGALDRTNINAFLKKFGSRNWSAIDFASFSKAHRPSLRRYDFSVEAVLAGRVA